MLDVKKLLKKAIKRKVRVTDALIVSFLISGNLLYAENLTVMKDEIIINENGNGYEPPSGTDIFNNYGTISGSTPYISNSISGNGIYLGNIKTVNNYGIISGSSFNGNEKTRGNGMLGIDETGFETINNYGVISGSTYAEEAPNSNFVSPEYRRVLSSGNGISGNTYNEINNYGFISGFVYAYQPDESGNGISGNTYNEINNNGVISGYGNTPEGYNDTWPIEGYAYSNESANGIYSRQGIENVNNKGIISGFAVVNHGNVSYSGGSDDNGNGVLSGYYNSPAGDIGNINNNGVISGSFIFNTKKSDNSVPGKKFHVGNGIYSNQGIENVNNNGIINGYSYYTKASKFENWIRRSGNGISTAGVIETINNNGTVSGYHGPIDSPSARYIGNGIYTKGTITEGTITKVIESITNNGVVKGSENAILITTNTAPGEDIITNNGILAGRNIVRKASVTQDEHGIPTYENISYTNNGIAITLNPDNSGNISSITNGTGGLVGEKTIINGNISGTDSSILATNLTTSDNLIINGAGVAKGALVVNKDTNLTNSIVNGYNTAVYIEEGKTITATNTTFNGGGFGTFNEVTQKLDYAAVIKGDIGNNTLEILGNSIINGKVDLGAGDDIFKVSDKAQINGAVDLGAGNDNLLVSNGTQINGDLDGGAGTDKLQLGDGNLNINHPLNKHDGNNDGKIDNGDYRGLAIYHEIKNFENIDVKGAVTLYETAKITGESEIKIGKDSSLNLRIDPTKTDGSGRIIGHALYTPGNKNITGEVHTGNGTINEYESKGGGTLNVITNGLGVGGVIAMSELNLPKVALLENTDTSIGTTNLDSNLYVRTDSIIHSATIHTGENPVVLDTGTTPQVGDIKVTVGPDLFELISPPEPPKPPVDPEPPIDPEPPKPPVDPEPPVNKYQPRYTQLNEIYKGLIADSDNINAIYPTTSITLLKQYLDYPVLSESAITEIALGNLLTLLNEIYTASPYSFSSELSRESMGLYSDNIIDNPFKAKEKEWMIYGGLLHLNADLKDKYYYGKNYHGFDTVDKATNLKVDNKVTGAYALAEYGIDSTLSAGAILGGSKNKSDISNGSNLDGNSFYIGGYFKKDIEELRVIGGIGYQYTDYDAKRVAGNMMQSFSYDNDYSDNGLNIYLSGKYNYALGNDFYLVPKAKLSYTYIDQDSVNEGDKPLAMNVDSKSFDVFEGLIGVDLKKVFLHENGKSAIKAGVAYKRILSGYEDDYLTANMKNGSDFDLLVPDKVKNNYIAGIGYEYESQKGVLFNVNGSYSFDVKENNSTKDNSRTKNSANGWSIGVGIGYKLP